MGGHQFTAKNKIGEGLFAEVYKIQRNNKDCAAKLFKIPFDAMNSLDKSRELEIL